MKNPIILLVNLEKATCNMYNLNLIMLRFIPVLIHNLKYDLNIIPKNNENYSTFSKKVIIDEYEQQWNLTKYLKCNRKYYNKTLDKYS